MRIILLAILFGCPSSGSFASEQQITHWGLENRAGIMKSPLREHAEFICHKDHAGLDLAAAEPLIDARARLEAALDVGGLLIVVEIEDLGCAYCAAAIERAFSSRPEIAAAHVNVRDGTLSLATVKGEAPEDRIIRKLIKRRGYAVAEIRRDASIEETAAVTPAPRQ